MMKKILALCFLLLFAATAYAAEKEVFSFRDIEFGMSKEDVLSIETYELISQSESGDDTILI